MNKLELKKNTRFQPCTNVLTRRAGVQCLLAAAFMLPCVYLSELLHLLEQPLFSRVYYGNLNATFFAILAAAYLYAFLAVFHRQIKRRLGLSPFNSARKKLSIARKAAIYCMTVVPVLLTALALHCRFKLIYELGERITGMTLLGNAVGYIYAAAKLLCAIYLIFLVECAFDRFFVRRPPLPFGGMAAMLTFGLCEMIFTPSRFALLYLVLFLYYGVIYLVSERRFGVTYAAAAILYIL